MARDLTDGTWPLPGDKGLTGLFQDRVAASRDAVAYRQFDHCSAAWRDHSWQDIADRVTHVRAALHSEGLNSGDRVAIALPNGIDWVAVDLAALSLGMVVVPLYLHDSPAGMAFILKHSGARLVVVDTAARWQSLLPQRADLTELAHVWIRDELDAKNATSVQPRVATMAEALGRANRLPSSSPTDADALATIVYTSGTTGRPKGVMLSQRALLLNAMAGAKVIPPRPDDVFLSCLPLAHAFERTVGYYLPMLGGSTVVYARSIELLAEDLRQQRPTVFLGVPRLYERACAAIRSKAQHNWLKRGLLTFTARAGWEDFEAGHGRAQKLGSVKRRLWSILDRSVGMQVRAAFGGRVRVAVTGGAPLPVDVSRFLIGLGLPLVEGYGLTEAGPVVASNSVDDNLPGSVGRPLEGVEVRISQKGELMVRSPSMMLGYWQAVATTADAIDQQGWLHTGDLAEIEDGRVFIRGRLKELIVLSTGEKLVPTEVEARILRNPLFENVLVIGDGRPFLAAVLTLKNEHWAALARAEGIPVEEPSHDNARAEVLRILEKELEDLARHAHVRAVHLTLEPWTIANGLLTPTLKAKRGPVQEKFATEIAALYSQDPRARMVARE